MIGVRIALVTGLAPLVCLLLSAGAGRASDWRVDVLAKTGDTVMVGTNGTAAQIGSWSSYHSGRATSTSGAVAFITTVTVPDGAGVATEHLAAVRSNGNQLRLLLREGETVPLEESNKDGLVESVEAVFVTANGTVLVTFTVLHPDSVQVGRSVLSVTPDGTRRVFLTDVRHACTPVDWTGWSPRASSCSRREAGWCSEPRQRTVMVRSCAR